MAGFGQRARRPTRQFSLAQPLECHRHFECAGHGDVADMALLHTQALELGLTDLRHAVGDVLLLAGAVDEGGVVLVDLDGLRGAELLEGGVLELVAELLGDHLAFGAQMIAPKVRMAMSSSIQSTSKKGEHLV